MICSASSEIECRACRNAARAPVTTDTQELTLSPDVTQWYQVDAVVGRKVGWQVVGRQRLFRTEMGGQVCRLSVPIRDVKMRKRIRIYGRTQPRQVCSDALECLGHRVRSRRKQCDGRTALSRSHRRVHTGAARDQGVGAVEQIERRAADNENLDISQSIHHAESIMTFNTIFMQRARSKT